MYVDAHGTLFFLASATLSGFLFLPGLLGFFFSLVFTCLQGIAFQILAVLVSADRALFSFASTASGTDLTRKSGQAGSCYQT